MSEYSRHRKQTTAHLPPTEKQRQAARKALASIIERLEKAQATHRRGFADREGRINAAKGRLIDLLNELD